MQNNRQATVIIACFNEQDNIERCIRTVASEFPEGEILVVHGGTDNTSKIANELKNEFPQVRVIVNENDRGKGHAIRKGIECASHDVMVQFDADNQFFASDLRATVGPVLEGKADVILGSRFLPSADRTAYMPSLFRDWGNRVLSLYVSALVGKKVTDVTAGLKAWSRNSINKIDLTDDRYSYEAEIVVRSIKLNLRVLEVPVRYASRTDGESMHLGTMDVIFAGLLIMLNCVKFHKR